MESSFSLMRLQHLLLGLSAALLSEGQGLLLSLCGGLIVAGERHCWLSGLACRTPLPFAGLNSLPNCLSNCALLCWCNRGPEC